MRILATSLITLVTLTCLHPAAHAGDIVAVQENGRTVYVNAAPKEGPARRPAASASAQAPVLVYWSRSENRWKRVKPPTRTAMRAAQSAASEVSRYVATQPMSTGTATAPEIAPEARELVRGRSVTPQAIEDAIQQAAARHNVDANLVRAIIKVESNFNPRAVSHKGAMGLMQLMPGTARELNVTNAFDPQQNVDAGVRHVKGLLNRFSGDVSLTLAAYNAGAGAVQRNRGVPPYRETRDYVKKITRIYTGEVSGISASGAYVNPVRMWRDSSGKLVASNVE